MNMEYYKKYEPIGGKWNFVRELGSGAYGTVFEIERNDFTKVRSALKIVTIPSSRSELDSYRKENFDHDETSVTSYFFGMVQEFIKEIQVMSQLKGYANIVNYEDHDVKKHEDDIGWDIFIRMELLTPLNDYYSKIKTGETHIAELGIDICRALEACEGQNIIHRDIKPSNIFVSKNGEYKLGDFGMARTLEKSLSGLSKKGTYTYMAPEVYKGERYGSTVDIYSLGIVMYRLLNNNMEPFRTGNTYNDAENALKKRIEGKIEIPPPSGARPVLADVILKACEYRPENRFRNAAEMRKALEIALSEIRVEEQLDETIGVFDSTYIPPKKATVSTPKPPTGIETKSDYESGVKPSLPSWEAPASEPKSFKSTMGSSFKKPDGGPGTGMLRKSSSKDIKTDISSVPPKSGPDSGISGDPSLKRRTTWCGFKKPGGL